MGAGTERSRNLPPTPVLNYLEKKKEIEKEEICHILIKKLNLFLNATPSAF
jgi:hypothetical protein